MSDIMIIVYAILFSLTSIFLAVYFKRLRSITSEYIRSRKVFEDIIFSFNKDLQRCEERVQEIIKSHQDVAAEGDRIMEEIRREFAEVKDKLEGLIRHRERISAELEDLKGKFEELSAKYSEILRKMSEIEVASVRGSEHESERIARSSIPAAGGEALASLTDTEMRVLEILAKEGEKTAPEIKEKIGLTREHTARLLKNLYERGYLERRSDKVPYVYRLNREVEEILKGKR